MRKRIIEQLLAKTLRSTAWMVLCGAFFASCSEELEPSPASVGRELRFHVAQGESGGADRAATRSTPVTEGAFHRSFGVLAYSYPSGTTDGWTQAAPKFMYDTEASDDDGSGTYRTEATYYLPGKGTDVAFFAYAPYQAEGLTLPEKDKTGAPVYRYTVPTDVARQSDLCFAGPKTVQGEREDGTVRLSFHHALTAVSFKEGSGMVTGTITGITLTGLSGKGTYDGKDWTLTNEASCTYSLALNLSVPQGEGAALTSGEQTFMLLPQTLSGGATLQVTYTEPGGTEKTLTTSLGSRTWKPGEHVTYKLKMASDRLEIEEVIGGTWGDGGEAGENATPEYMPRRLKMGDYFYSDGTYSDGGLRRILADGTYVIAEPKPAPKSGKKVVGIVYATFQDHPERFGEAEIKMLRASGVEPHALVMAVKDAGDEECRFSNLPKELGHPENNSPKNCYESISGYANHLYIKEQLEKGTIAEKPDAFCQAEAYNKTCPIDGITTGWYLPASGQWWDIFKYMGKAYLDYEEDDDNESPFNNGGFLDVLTIGKRNVLSELNGWMKEIKDTDKTTFEDEYNYFSSSLHKITTGRPPRGFCCYFFEVFDNSYDNWQPDDLLEPTALEVKGYATSGRVRPVLAF